MLYIDQIVLFCTEGIQGYAMRAAQTWNGAPV